MDFANIGDLLQPLLEASQRYGDALVPLGRTVLSLSLLMTLASAIYAFWTGALHGAVAKLLRGGILFAIPFILLTGDNWLNTTGHLANFFQQEVTQPLIAKSGYGAGGNGTTIIKNMVAKIANGIWPQQPPPQTQGAWDQIKSFADLNIAGSLTNMLLQLILTVVGFMLIVSILFALYSPLLMLQIGVILGPILICWLPFRPMEDLAKRWLSFMITSGMSLVIGVLLVLIVSSSIDTFISTLSLLDDPASGVPWPGSLLAKIGAFASAAAAMFYISIFLQRTDAIASALVGGITEGSGIGSDMSQKASSLKDSFSSSKGGGGSETPPPPGK